MNHSVPFFVSHSGSKYSKPNYGTPLVIAAAFVVASLIIYCMCNKRSRRSCGVCTSARAATNQNAGGVLEAKNKEHLEELVGSDNVVVLFYAPWCSHCEQMKPEFVKAAQMHPEGTYAMVDCENAVGHDTLKGHNIQGFPTVRSYQKGSLKSEHTGARSAEAFVNFAKASAK